MHRTKPTANANQSVGALLDPMARRLRASDNTDARKLMVSLGGGRMADRVTCRGSERVHDLFDGADLSSKSRLIGTDLTGANLTNASVGGAVVSNIELTGGRQTGVDGSLVAPSLVGKELRGVTDRVARVRDLRRDHPGARIDLRRASLRGLLLVGIDLRGARLDGADLTRVDLGGARR